MTTTSSSDSTRPKTPPAQPLRCLPARACWVKSTTWDGRLNKKTVSMYLPVHSKGTSSQREDPRFRRCRCTCLPRHPSGPPPGREAHRGAATAGQLSPGSQFLGQTGRCGELGSWEGGGTWLWVWPLFIPSSPRRVTSAAACQRSTCPRSCVAASVLDELYIKIQMLYAC